MDHKSATDPISQPQDIRYLKADKKHNQNELDNKHLMSAYSARNEVVHSFGPTFSDSGAPDNLRIPRYALPHKELSSLNESYMHPPRSPLSSSVVISGSTQVPTSDGSSMQELPPFDTASYSPPHRSYSAADFTALGRLGQGAHGQVLLVLDNVKREYMALKVVEKEHLHLSSYPRIFEEQLVGRRLVDCPWALRLVGSFQDNECFYFLSNYHPAGDLTKLVRRFSKLPTNLVRHYAAELIISMEELHRRHVMHRDIKPDNILVDDKGHLLLADFGVSRSFGEASEARPWERFRRWANRTPEPEQDASSDGHSQPDRSRTTCGTPGFMAPEAYENSGYSYEADIWSAGVVIHFLLLGRLPFGMIPARQSYKELCTRTKVLQLEYGMDERVPGHARTLLRRMLDKDPARRITISELKEHQFFAGLCWETVSRRETTVDFPMVAAYLEQKASTLPIEDGITIPCGTPYKTGECPFPWFDYSSPPPEDKMLGTGTLKLDAIDTSTVTTPPQRKSSLAKKFKDLWKRSPTVEHSP